MRSSWPWRAHGPDNGAIDAILTGFAWARAEVIATEGSANAPKDSVNPLATVRLVNFLSVTRVSSLKPCKSSSLAAIA